LTDPHLVISPQLLDIYLIPTIAGLCYISPFPHRASLSPYYRQFTTSIIIQKPSTCNETVLLRLVPEDEVTRAAQAQRQPPAPLRPEAAFRNDEPLHPAPTEMGIWTWMGRLEALVEDVVGKDE
jgi:hypothetical protein